MKRYFILFGMMMILPLGISFAENIVVNVPNNITYSKSAVNLQNDMRKLWEDHVWYTRNLIISAVANLDDTNDVSDRLLKNQDDIGNAIRGYYGDAAGNKLSQLLRDHILIAVEVVKAAQSGNEENVKQASAKWSANANDIATFLSQANPNWPKQTLVDLLQTHLDLTTNEAVARIKKNWSADIEAFDKGNDHILILSDALTNGIIKQFPEKFKN